MRGKSIKLISCRYTFLNKVSELWWSVNRGNHLWKGLQYIQTSIRAQLIQHVPTVADRSRAARVSTDDNMVIKPFHRVAKKQAIRGTNERNFGAQAESELPNAELNIYYIIIVAILILLLEEMMAHSSRAHNLEITLLFPALPVRSPPHFSAFLFVRTSVCLFLHLARRSSVNLRIKTLCPMHAPTSETSVWLNCFLCVCGIVCESVRDRMAWYVQGTRYNCYCR